MTSSVDETFRRAVSAMQTGQAEAAERLFKQVLHSHPRHVGALNLFCVVLTQAGRYDEAERYVCLALDEDATSDVTFYNYGLILKALNRPAEALQRFSQALKINAAVAETWNNRGTVFNDLKRYREAIADFDRAIAANANYADAFVNKGKALAELKLYEQSRAAYDRALTLKPALAEAWLGRGNVLIELMQYDNAIAAYDRALALKPDLAASWLGLGNLCNEVKQYGKAVAAFDKALELVPDWVEAHNNRGAALLNLKRYSEALTSCERAIALAPRLALPHNNRGIALQYLKRHSEALASCDQAISLDRKFADGWLLRGNILKELGRYDDAGTAYERALVLDADLAEAWVGLGNVFTELRRFGDAVAAYDKARVLKPDLAPAWLGCGNVFTELGRQQDGLAAYDKALALQPDLAEAWLGRGNVFTNLKRYDEAFAAYDRAVALKPDLRYAAGARLHTKQFLCDWTNLEAETAQILTMLREGMPAAAPFIILAIASSPADQLQCARRYVQDQPSFPQTWRGEVYSHDRIRVAYLSADFHEHAVANQMVGLFEQHDKARFEVTGISFGPDQDSAMRRRVTGAFERFVDVENKSDQEIADLVRRLEIDIAIDLQGYTRNNRRGVLARRAAPIQVNYLGYSGTMGAGYIDYIVADPMVIPEAHFEFYSEKVVWLPDCFMANDAARPIAERTPTRRELHLPDTGFVFCCFNPSYKINSTIFDIWMRLLKQVDGSVLWLRENGPVASKNLGLEAERRGVAAERLVFASATPLVADHLARHRQADLFLDTLPYNAHATTSDALWAGLPVLTCLGGAFAGRVAGSMLKAIGLDQLITHSLEEYEALALQLAHDPPYLASLKDKLARNRDTAPLFNTERVTRHIEAAYTMMWQRYQSGEMPKSRSGELEPIRIS